MTKKDEDILRKCDRGMLRYMASVKWQDGEPRSAVWGISWKELDREECNGLDM